MRKIRLFSIAALALAMAACSSEENTLETQSPAAPGKLHFTATIATPGNGAGTRTEYSEQADGTINVAWKQDDEIAIVNDVAPGTNYKMTVETVNTTDGSATISGDITGNDGAAVTAYYPYSAREEWTTFTGKFQSQDGTLKYIQDNLDYRIGNGTLSVSGTQATLKEALSMNSKIAILKLTLQDNAATPNALKATKVAVKNGDEVIAATATLGTATSTVYLGVLLTSNITGANITIEATVGSDTYTFSKTGLSLTAGKYYQSTLKMAKASVPANTPVIAQADCTFSPSNGKSTLSNANITTSMEYSTDGGTTWTDVTSNGSIASLAAGTVQIRVKETVDNLASEAVSITVPEVLHINELVGPYTGDRLTCEYYAGETWQALVDRYDLIKVYSGRAAFGSDGFIYYENGSAVPVTDLVDNTKTYEVQ